MKFQRTCLVSLFLLSSMINAQELIPATYEWRVLNGHYPYDSSGYIFLSSADAMADLCALVRTKERTYYYGKSYVTTCPSSGVEENFSYSAEYYSSNYTERYEYSTVPPRDPVDYERGVMLSRRAVCKSAAYPVLHSQITNGKYSRAECGPQYILVLPEESPPTQCVMGNPINPSSGAKIQQESDVEMRAASGISFNRIYSSNSRNIAGVWHHTYTRSISALPDGQIGAIREKGTPQSNKSTACYSGWSTIKSRINDSWARNATSQWNDLKQACEITKAGRVVKILPVLPASAELRWVIPSYVQTVREDGSILGFHQVTRSLFTGVNGASSVIRKTGIDGWQLITGNNNIEMYSVTGKLLSITASNGLKQELFYDADSGLLSRVEDSTGRELVFAYSGNQISSVTVDGDKVTSYTYNTLGLLTQVTRPDNTTRTYHYENTNFPTALTGITDERNVRYATWTYDAQGRTISSEHAGGTDKTLLAFNADGSTTVTNPLGKQTTYHFDDIAGARRVTQVEGHVTASCEGANKNYTYTPEGWIESKTDWKGNVTTYSYNTFGQEISRTEASGTPEARTITTEWHPDFYVKTHVVDGGKEKLYTYDNNGRLSSNTTSTQ